MRVVVFGATGDQGLPQLQALRAARHTAVAASRGGLSEVEGIEAVAADFGNPSSLVDAMAGCEAVFATFPSSSFHPAGPLINGARAVGEAARTAGVQLRACGPGRVRTGPATDLRALRDWPSA